MNNRNTAIFALLLLLTVCVRFYLYYTINLAKLVNIVPDDVSYYFKIAENFVLGKGLTFDSISQTNGVHPLWLLFITPLFWLEHLGITREVIFRIIFFVQTLLQISAGFLLYKSFRSVLNNNSAFIIFALFLYLIIIRFTNGLETALFFFLIAVLIRYIVSIRQIKHWFIAGIIAGSCMLTRLDFIFIVPALFIVAIADYKNKRLLNAYAVIYFVSGVILLLSPYLIYNQLVFGNMVPISGVLKSGTPGSFQSALENFKYLNKAYMVVYPLAIIYLWFYWNKRNRFVESSDTIKNYRLIVALFCLTVIMHTIHSAFFMKWGLFEWHFALYPVTALLILAEPVNFLINKYQGWSYLIKYAVFILVFGFICFRSASYRLYPGGWAEEVYNAAVWTKTNTLQENIFAMKDAGHFAFFSGRSVINLDGLVNSFNYQEILRDKKLNSYLIQNKVSYIVQHAFPGRKDVIAGDYEMFSIPYNSHRYGVFSEPLLLSKKQEVYRSGIYDHEGEAMVLLIWKYSVNL